jgi:uncharacterized membrane protein
LQKKTLAIQLSIGGVMTALVFIFTNVKIVLPLGPTNQIIHMGNAFCLIAGLILSPVLAGLCAGLGCFIFDILTPAFFSSALSTFFLKFIMAFSCSIIVLRAKNCRERSLNTLASAAAVFIHITLHGIKTFLWNIFFLQLPMESALVLLGKVSFVSLINGILAVLTAVPLAMAIKKALTKIGISKLLAL